MLRIGIATKKEKFVVDDRDHNEFKIYNFTISADELSFHKIFHSAFATPARYVMEIYRRLASIGNDGGIFVFNPLFTINPLLARIIFQQLHELHGSSEIIIISDKQNRPVGYLFPPAMRIEDAKYLNLLSAVDSSLDLLFLRNTYLLPAWNTQLPHAPLRLLSSGLFYLSDNYRRIYAWITQSALTALSNKLQCRYADNRDLEQVSSSQQRHLKELRDAVPFAAINPYHAGDVLFFALALKNIPHFVDKAVVDMRYRDILAEACIDVEPITIAAAPPNRDGKNMPEDVYFFEFANDLPPDNFYLFSRITGDYHITSFHLIDHFAFSMGMGFLGKEDLVINTKSYPDLYRPNNAGMQYRILLHFDAGWSLKIYPKSFQEQLINLLHANKYEITVLSDEEEAEDGSCKRVKFRNLAHFKTLLMNHHLLVGSDSFPSHYAVHILGLPTICLFSSTKPVNSNAGISERYAYLEQGLACKPCYSLTRCEKKSKDYCENFVGPERVFAEVNKMLADNYPSGPNRSNYPEHHIAGPVNQGHKPSRSDQIHAEDVMGFERDPESIVITLKAKSSSLPARWMLSVKYCTEYILERYVAVIKSKGFIAAHGKAMRSFAKVVLSLFSKQQVKR